MRVLVVSNHTLFAQGMDEWLRQQTGLEIVGRESDMEKAAQCIAHLQPDVILLDIGREAGDPTTALMRFLRNGLDTQIIGVNLQDNCISLFYRGNWMMQKVGGLLQVIQDAQNAACS